MPDNILQIGGQFDLGNIPAGAQQTAAAIHGIGQAAVDASQVTAASAAAMRAQFEDEQVAFAQAKNKEIAVDQAWTAALRENAARAATAAREHAEEVKKAAEERARAQEEAARRTELALKREEAAAERSAEKMREIEIIAARALKSGSIGGIIGATGEIAGVAAMASVVEHYVEKIKDLAIESEHMSAMAGVAVPRLVALQEAMRSAGAPADGLTTSTLRFASAISAAEEGSISQQKALRQLGLVNTDNTLKTKDFITAYEIVATHMAASTNIIEDNNAARELFGRTIGTQLGFLRSEGGALSDDIAQFIPYGRAVEAVGESARKLNSIEAASNRILMEQAAEVLPAVVTGLQGAIGWFTRLEAAIGRDATYLTALMQSAKVFSDWSTGGFISGAFVDNGAGTKNSVDKITDIWKAARENVQGIQKQMNADIDGLYKEPKKPKEHPDDSQEGNAGLLREAQAKREARAAEQIEFKAKTQLALLDLDRAHYETEYKTGEIALNELLKLKADANIKERQISQDKFSKLSALYASDPEKGPEQQKAADEKLEAIDHYNKEQYKLVSEGLEATYALRKKADEDANKAAKEAMAENRKALEKGIEESVKAFALATGSGAEAAALSARKSVEAAQREMAAASESWVAGPLIGETRGETRGSDILEIASAMSIQTQKVDELTEAERRRLNFEDELAQAIKNVAEEQREANITLDEANEKARADRDKAISETAIKEAKIHGASATEQIAMLKAYDQELKNNIDLETAAKLSALPPGATDKQKNAIIGEGVSQKAAIDTSEQAKDLDLTEAEFTRFFGKVNSQMQSALTAWINGTESFSKAFRKMGQQMVTDLITSLAMQAVKWVEHHLLLQGLEVSFNAVMKALGLERAIADRSTQAVAWAAGAPQRGVEVAALASLAAAGTFAQVMAESGDPLQAAAEATAAAAATTKLGSVYVAEKGGIMGDHPALAMLHPHEMVLPEKVSQGVQNFINGGGNNAPGAPAPGKAGPQLHYYAPHGVTDEQMERDARKMNRHIQRQVRLGFMPLMSEA